MMTELEMSKVNAEISKLIAESIKFQEESLKLQNEARKLDTERLKMERERTWYPLVLMTGAMGAGAGLAAIIIKMFT